MRPLPGVTYFSVHVPCPRCGEGSVTIGQRDCLFCSGDVAPQKGTAHGRKRKSRSEGR